MIRSINTALGFLAYYLTAVNRHGIQAPFAFQLNEAVFRKDIREFPQQDFEELRRKLLRDKTEIDIRDFGAGFGGYNFNRRTISYIVRNSVRQPRYARLLFRMVRHLKPGVILELGTSVGISALYMAAGNPGARLVTLEGCPSTAALARTSFSLFPEYNIILEEGRFDEVLPDVLSRLPFIDFLFVDGHHRYQPTIDYVGACYGKLSSNAVVVVDDINWSPEMRRAWSFLKADPRFTLSIDLFMMGLLFKSPDLSKQNLLVRY